MLLFSLATLAIASISGFLCLTIQEDVVRPCLGFLAAFSVLLTLFCAPWALKLTLLALPIGFERLYLKSPSQG
ncbi:MAG: riboflavin synthase subunit alpha [Microcystaceae cyanobacterium]